jgi:L-alanine-DL-glutamate epimerase-like enolase superfamily enzyme
MKIVDVRSTIAAVQRRRPLKTSYGESPATVTVIAQVFTDEGITGIGQTVAPAPFFGDTAEAIKVNIDKYLRPAVLGQDPFDIERLFDLMYRALRGTRYPITAVEFALWDIKGKALNVPVYQLLGGKFSAGIPLHAFVERMSV